MGRIDIYFSLGSNQGDKSANLEVATAMLEAYFGKKADRAATPIITSPQGFVSDEMFLNTALMFRIVDTGQNPELHALAILRECKKIEAALGRKITPIEYNNDGTRMYKSRPIDIDILLYGDSVINTKELTIPHKEMKNREFVMIPLKEIYSI